MEKQLYNETPVGSQEPQGMLLTEYQAKALSYRLPSAVPAYALLNLAGEVGELFSLIAKGIRDGVEDKEAHQINIVKELGDVLWHVAAVAADHGVPLDDIARVNLEKLESRKQRNTLTGSGDNR